MDILEEIKTNPTSWRTRIQSDKPKAFRNVTESRPRIPCLTTTKIPIETRVKMVEYYSKYDTYGEMRKAWEKDFGTKPPLQTSFVLINKKFDETGSVHDLYTTRATAVRAKKRDAEIVSKAKGVLKKDPHRTLTGVAEELGLSVQQMFKIRKRTNFLPCRQFVLREMAYYKSKLQGLKVKHNILKKKMKKRNAAPIPKKPKFDLKNRRERCRVPKTSAKSIRAKMSLFEYPPEESNLENDEAQLDPSTQEGEDILLDSDSSSSSSSTTSSSSESDEEIMREIECT